MASGLGPTSTTATEKARETFHILASHLATTGLVTHAGSLNDNHRNAVFRCVVQYIHIIIEPCLAGSCGVEASYAILRVRKFKRLPRQGSL